MKKLYNMILDLYKKEYIITGKNSIFDDTPYRGKDFEIVVEPLGQWEHIAINLKSSDFRSIYITNNNKIAYECFLRQVQSWTGIEYPNGKEIVCTKKNKELLLENDLFFCVLINLACLRFRNEIEKAKEKLSRLYQQILLESKQINQDITISRNNNKEEKFL